MIRRKRGKYVGIPVASTAIKEWKEEGRPKPFMQEDGQTWYHQEMAITYLTDFSQSGIIIVWSMHNDIIIYS